MCCILWTPTINIRFKCTSGSSTPVYFTGLRRVRLPRVPSLRFEVNLLADFIHLEPPGVTTRRDRVSGPRAPQSGSHSVLCGALCPNMAVFLPPGEALSHYVVPSMRPCGRKHPETTFGPGFVTQPPQVAVRILPASMSHKYECGRTLQLA